MLALVDRALEEGIDALKRGEFAVFALLEIGSERRLTRFLGHEPAQAIEGARRLVLERRAEVERYVIGSVGDINVGGPFVRAMIAEAAERGSERGRRLGQRLVEAEGRVTGAMSERLVLATIENLLVEDRALVVLCERCGAKNRVGLARLRSHVPRCGSCRELLAS